MSKHGDIDKIRLTQRVLKSPDPSYGPMLSVEQRIERAIAEAVRKERRRCREKERDPLIDACQDALHGLSLNQDFCYEEQDEIAEKIRSTLAAVRKIQEERP